MQSAVVICDSAGDENGEYYYFNGVYGELDTDRRYQKKRSLIDDSWPFEVLRGSYRSIRVYVEGSRLGAHYNR